MTEVNEKKKDAPFFKMNKYCQEHIILYDFATIQSSLPTRVVSVESPSSLYQRAKYLPM